MINPVYELQYVPVCSLSINLHQQHKKRYCREEGSRTSADSKKTNKKKSPHSLKYLVYVSLKAKYRANETLKK